MSELGCASAAVPRQQKWRVEGPWAGPMVAARWVAFLLKEKVEPTDY
jgi:hypothetical protein